MKVLIGGPGQPAHVTVIHGTKELADGAPAVVLTIREFPNGGLAVYVDRGDPIWGLPVDPATGRPPTSKILIVDP